jgi:release factor glutamine methyltransferase
MRPSEAVARGTRRVGSVAEAKTLLAHALAVEPGRLPLIPDVSEADLAAFEALIERRLAGEPVQHLTGRAYFRTISVAVGPGVFIPRPETELLVGWAIEALAGRVNSGFTGPYDRVNPLLTPPLPVVVELCAGSGAISKALANELPGPEYWAVELSPHAWPYLVANLAESGVRAAQGDMADALYHLDGTVDLVIANPPYVPETARDGLPVDVLRDPDLALFSGPDGLDALVVVADVAARLLRPGGWVCAEHDDTHGTAAPALFAARGFSEVADHLDLAGRPRFVTARAGDPVPGRMSP